MGQGNASDQAALARSTIAARLRARRGDLQQEALVKIRENAAAPSPDAEYVIGLRQAIGAALDCGLEVLERCKPGEVSLPPALLLQARLSAQAGVELEAALHPYLAGHSLFTDAIVRELTGDPALSAGALAQLLAEQSALLQRFHAAVGEEYRLEASRQEQPASRQTQIVRRLLAGEPVATAELGYELEAWHVGVVASGPESAAALKALAKQLDRRLLILDRGEKSVCAWLGGYRRIGSDRVERSAARHWPEGASLAIGEPGEGLSGWRLTNSQARALAPLAEHGAQRVLRYADKALLSSILGDDLFLHSMRQLYLVPLEAERDGGRTLRRTLQAYFAAERNISSTAAALGVTRKTVTARLKRVERRIGRLLSSCSFEVEAVMALDRALTTPEATRLG